MPATHISETLPTTMNFLTLVKDLGEVHVTWLEGLGASYRIKGYFNLETREDNRLKVDFDAVAFGGNYGGHNINVQITDATKVELLKAMRCTPEDVEELLAEVQRKMLNNEMIVDYEKLKPESDDKDPFGGIGP